MTLADVPSVVVRPIGDFDDWQALFEAVASEALWLGAPAGRSSTVAWPATTPPSSWPSPKAAWWDRPA